MTIGIGFSCADGIVLVADQQISYGAYFKKYECKIFTHNTSDWAIGMTYSGDPELMKIVDEKFTEAMENTYRSKKPGSGSEIKKLLEKTLSGMKTLDTAQDPEGFYMLCGVVIPGKEMALIRTERKKVREVKELSSYVGIGDSSVLQYLTRMLVADNILNAKQAMYIGVYLDCPSQGIYSRLRWRNRFHDPKTEWGCRASCTYVQPGAAGFETGVRPKKDAFRSKRSKQARCRVRFCV